MGISKLLDAIEQSGLQEIAKGYAFDTATRIVTTGSDIKQEYEDSESMDQFDDDTALTAHVLSNPVNWGIADDRWKGFCVSWNEKR